MSDDVPVTGKTKQPWPFLPQVLREEWPEVKKAKFAFLLCAVVFLFIGGWAVYSLFNIFIIPGKEATIQALHVKSETLGGGVPGAAAVVWGGPTNSLYITNEYCFYQASTNCAITNILNPSNTALMPWASITVLNSSSNAITFYVTDASARPVGGVTSNALRIGPGKLGIMNVQCIGQGISSYVTLPQQ
jgi:hypothetical protein